MDAYYEDEAVTLFHGDNRDVLKELPTASVDACVTDPPYELAFMGRKWDASGIAYDKWLWAEVWRVLKPGGHLLAFGGTRTWHRLACAIEDAGFDIRDSIAWMYGSGFPKSLDVSKAIDKAAGAEREVVGHAEVWGRGVDRFSDIGQDIPVNGNAQVAITAPATPNARKWQGWGTALKPAFEPVVVARKPLQGTVAENVLKWGTGALNIDSCRIETTETLDRAKAGWGNVAVGADNYGNFNSIGVTVEGGRWPANVVLDESQAAELDRQSGVSVSKSGGASGTTWTVNGIGAVPRIDDRGGHDDCGGASRFFYVPKANSHERPRGDDGTAHPTVKPVDLMRYLVKLVTPPGGVVLDPFAGSGSTLEACIVEGFKCVGIELTDEYLPLIVKRVTKPIEPVMF